MPVHIVRIVECLSHDLSLDSYTCKVLKDRFRSEGIGFLTKTLPKLANSVLVGIETGQFPTVDSLAARGMDTSSACTAFKMKRGLPIFLRGFLLDIFYEDGSLRNDPDPVGLYVIRQLCLYFYKLVLPFDDHTTTAALQKFITTDEQLDSNYCSEFVNEVRKTVEKDYFARFPHFHTILQSSRPRFGPGSVSSSSGLKHRYYLEKLNHRSLRTPFRDLYGFVKPYPSAPVKVESIEYKPKFSELVFVPKDSRGPRTITKEPYDTIRFQMSFFDFTTKWLEKVTNGEIRFIDQSLHQELARKGSLDGSWATIDLKDASDSVSYDIVRTIFRNVPGVFNFLKRFRSSHTILPDGSVKRLKKLAGMGSGFTFPIMSLLIHSSIKTYARKLGYSFPCYVYGDDIIVPSKYAALCVKALGLVGLVVNTAKSFKNVMLRRSFSHPAYFRESCGGDFFMGNNVTPVRLRMAHSDLVQLDNTLRFNPKRWASFVLELERHCRELVKNGFSALPQYYYSLIERLVGALPTVSGESPVIGKYSTTPIREVTDAFGNCITKRVLVPIARQIEYKDYNPYVYLGRQLSRTALESWPSLLDPEDTRSEFGFVPVPYELKLVRKQVPSNVLT